MMKYSVILPVYNAAQTLHRCLDSLVPQLREDTELLIINDGSTDASPEICAEYAARCPRIRLISKENGGVSSARNLGLEHAGGEYILFVDSDDAVREDYFSTLDSALRDKPELLIFGVEALGGASLLSSASCHAAYFRGGESVNVLAKALRRQEFNLITTKVFRRELIEANRLRFDQRLDIGEDKVFSFAYATHVRSVRRISDRLYQLSMERQDSLSRKKRDNLLESVLLEHRLLLDSLQQSDLSDSEKAIYNRAVQYSFYRSAYTVCRKARQDVSGLGSSQKRIAGILRAYRDAPRFRPADLICGFVALPVRQGWSLAVSTIVSFFPKEKSR